MTHDSHPDDDPSLQRLLSDYLEQIDHGAQIDRRRIRRDHPKHADSLIAFLDDHARMREIVAPLRVAGSPECANTGFEPTLDSRMETVSSQTEFSVGDRFKYVGEYEILDEIARGGMGVVFRAHQSKLGREVALKMILAGRLASAADVDRFKREARAAAHLKHPNIVGVHEVGEHDGHHYFTMDLVAGRSLASIISEETLSPRHAAELIRIIAMAIEYAHLQGVLHRDLKPANILIDNDGQPHVSDFGLAKAMLDGDTRVELTATGQILGTPSYMSPEQASARHDDVGVASDVYSLGAILYACLVGRGPFVADSTVDTIRQVIEKQPVAPRLLSVAIPKDLETICLKCLQKEPDRRYASAADLADDLQRFIGGRPVQARPVPATTKLWSWSRRNPVIAGLMTLSLLLLFTGTIVSTYFAFRAADRARAEIAQRERADESANAANKAKREMAAALEREALARREAESARDQANQAKNLEVDARTQAEKSLANEQAARKLIADREREARWSEYVAKLTVLQRPWGDREFGQLSRMVNDLKPTNRQTDFRGWEWNYFDDLAERAATSLPVGERTVRGSWSPDGKTIATAGRQLQVWDANTGQLVFEKKLDTVLEHCVFSPSGRTIACGLLGGEIVIVDAKSGEVTRRWPAHQRGPHRLSFSPDGSQLASGSLDGSAAIWNVASGENVHQLCPVDKNNYLRNVSWHPTQPLVVISDRRGYVRVFDAESGQRKFSRRACGISCNVGHWSPDGQLLAGGGSFPNYEILLYSPSGEKQGTLNRAAGAAAWSPDSTRIALGGSDHDVRIISIAEDELMSTARFHAAPVKHLAWSPDAKSILSIDDSGVAKVWKVDAEIEDARIIHQGEAPVRTLRYHPDGRRIAGCSTDRLLRIWDSTGGDLLETSPEHSAAIKDFDWSDDGRQIISICADNTVRVWRPGSDVIRKPFESGLRAGAVHLWIDRRPGTRLFAFGEYADDTCLFDLSSAERMASVPIRAGYGRWSPRGDQLAIGVNIVDAQLNVLGRIPVPHENMTRLAWSPSGQLIAGALGDGRLIVSEASSPSAKPTVARGHRHALSAVAWHPSGTRLVTGDNDGSIKLWDVATLDEVWSTKVPGSIESLTWSPDGRHLVSSDGGVASQSDRADDHDRCSVRIWGSPKMKVLSKTPEMLPTRLALVLTDDPNARAAAKCIVDHGGSLTISRGSGDEVIRTRESIPQRACRIIDIDLSGSMITGEELVELHGLSALRHINLRSTSVSDADVRSLLQSLPSVNLLGLDASHREFAITPGGDVEHLKSKREELEALTTAITQAPNGREALLTRAKWYAKHLAWDKAYADLSTYLDHSSKNRWWNSAAAHAAFAAGDLEAYQRHIEQNLRQLSVFRLPAETGTAAYLVRAICLKPYSDVNLEALLPLAERFQGGNRDSFYHTKTLLMLRLRLEHDEQVLEICDRFLSRSTSPTQFILTSAVRAIALNRLGRAGEARQALLAAEPQAIEAWPEIEVGFEADYGDLDTFVAAKAILTEAKKNVSTPAAWKQEGKK